MNLKDKLSRLDRGTKKPAENKDASEINNQWAESLQQELDLRIISEGSSYYFLKENYYPVYSFSGFNELRDSGFVMENLHDLVEYRAGAQINIRKHLFIDLETTGLAGGAGTYAFLIGIGHLELDHIVVRQYLLPDFPHEWLMLKHFENNLISFEGIASFNGKTFDIPLLRNRFILNRQDSILDDLPHIDILHAARRVWKNRLGSCTLQNLEYHILGQERIGDIPGELIPQIYYEFIRRKPALQMRDVLEHNYHDIVNLILLAIQLGQVTENPQQKLTHPEDQFSLAQFYFTRNKFQLSLEILNYLNGKGNSDIISKKALHLQAMVYKKMGNFDKSSQLMHELLGHQKGHLPAIEELAKYYEHKTKDYQAALDLVEQGLNYIDFLQQLERPLPQERIRESLLYRRKRLQKKLEKC